MGGRYLVTGTQLGTIIGLATNNKAVNDQVNKIIEQQHICESENPLEEDLKDLRNCSVNLEKLKRLIANGWMNERV